MPVETPSDRDFACFACGLGKHKELGERCPECDAPLNAGPELTQQSVHGYLLSDYINRGHYGATYRATNRIGKNAAIKIVPKSLYNARGKDFYEEIKIYSALGAHPNIAELHDAGETELLLYRKKTEFYFVIMEWIDGVTLDAFFAQNVRIDAAFVYGAVLDMSAGLSRFEAVNLWHDDLNSGNILIKRLTNEEIQSRRAESPYIFKIVDAGSAVFRLAFPTKALNDLAFVGQHINALRKAAMSAESALPREDRFFLDQLGSLASSLLDEDPARRVASTSGIADIATRLFIDRFSLGQSSEATLGSPFDYLNANDFPDDSFINRLFSDKFPWIRDTIIPAAQSMLITGPRGSGKTMILRSMRLKGQLSRLTDKESIFVSDHVGFYISARLEIGNQAPLTKTPYWMSSEELVVSYFHLLYLYEVCETVHTAVLKKAMLLTRFSEGAFCKFVGDTLEEKVVSLPAALSIIKALQKSILSTKSDLEMPNALLGGNFMSELCSAIKSLCSEIQHKRVVFLLDDFSLPKIPSLVQRTLLPIIWNSGGGYTFRVTAHSESTEIVDMRDNVYQRNREFTEINLGSLYVNSLEQESQKISIQDSVNDIMRRRFEMSGRTAEWNAKSILGRRPSKTIALDIKERAENNKLRGLRYHSWETVVALCSGDISYLIDLVGKMIDQQGDMTKQVSTELQNRAIRHYARTELYRLQDYPSTSCNLYDIALNFGKVSRFKLENETVKDGDGSRPAEYLRIEVQMQDAVDELRSAIAELLRNGVFIDGGFSSSSQGIPARRLIFRKIFTPAFPTTYRSRDTLPMTAAHFQTFIKNPSNYLRRILAQAGVKAPEQQLTLDSLLEPSK